MLWAQNFFLFFFFKYSHTECQNCKHNPVKGKARILISVFHLWGHFYNKTQLQILND